MDIIAILSFKTKEPLNLTIVSRKCNIYLDTQQDGVNPDDLHSSREKWSPRLFGRLSSFIRSKAMMQHHYKSASSFNADDYDDNGGHIELIADRNRMNQMSDSPRNILDRYKRNFYFQNRSKLNKLRVNQRQQHANNKTTTDPTYKYHPILRHPTRMFPAGPLYPSDLVGSFDENSSIGRYYKNYPEINDCALRLFKYMAQNKDSAGNYCQARLEVMICSGSCVTSEYPDYTIPYKRSLHRSCNFVGRVQRTAILNDCSSPSVDESLKIYNYFEPIDCECKTCDNNQTLCLTT